MSCKTDQNERAITYLAEMVSYLKMNLIYVTENTCITKDGEWTFKPGYDPQIIIDALTDYNPLTDPATNLPKP